MSLAAVRIVRDYEALYEDWLGKGRGTAAAVDGLPIVPPTPARIAAMLEAMGHAEEDAVGTLGGTAIRASDVALHAVLAGCRPIYGPVVLAAVRAFLVEGESRLPRFADSAQAIIVNGPIRSRIGINCRDGLLGPGWRSNATIGRALRLLLGAVLGGPRTEGFGDPGQYTLCFGEDEEGTVWAPLHTDGGFDRGSSAVTVHSAAICKQSMFRAMPVNGREILRYLALFLRGRASGADHYGGEPLSILVLVGHELRRLLEVEWPDKAVIRQVLFDQLVGAALPGRRLALRSLDDLRIAAAGGVAYPTSWALVSPGVRPGTVAL